MAYIDTYKAVKTLINGGFDESQAKAIVDIIKDADNILTTQSDIVNFKNEIKSDIEHIKKQIATKADIANLRTELKTDIIITLKSDLKYDMSDMCFNITKWIAGLYVMIMILGLLIASLIIKIPIN